jgi:LysM repeat protein
MIARAMGARNPARYLAPIALVATVIAAYMIVHQGLAAKSTTSVSVPAVVNPAVAHREFSKARFYTVRAGDSLSVISAKTGVPLPTLESLNPGVNPAAIQAGQRLKLRK